MSQLDSFDITIIGAGVVGLAIAEEMSARSGGVLVVEKNTGVGMETSSRNSEVIHAGIYYPPGLLKSSLCVEGNRILYETCAARNIPHRRLGKLIVAAGEEECAVLEKIKKQGEQNGVADLASLGTRQIRSLEPEVTGVAGLFSPSTGIIDTHALMRSFTVNAQANGAVLAFRSEVSSITRTNGGYEVAINGGEYRFRTGVLVNSAGLYADKVAALAGIDVDRAGYRLKYCKGNYFSCSPAPKIRHLVYPAPLENNTGMGIHATLDLEGRLRFGPDSQYVDALDYNVDEKRGASFYEAISRYLPAITRESLHPDMSGIRPKLQGPGEPYRDFVITDEADRGYPGLINLIGLESPALTSCIPIARRVASLVAPYL